jgi:DNA-binding transcriptional ArsR family regulator
MVIKRQCKSNKSTFGISDMQLTEVARIFSMLAESSRLKLLRELMHESMTVSELMEATGMQQGNVSKHLSVLLSGGFVERVQEGNFARYVLCDPTVKTLCKLMCTRVEEYARRRLKALS